MVCRRGAKNPKRFKTCELSAGLTGAKLRKFQVTITRRRLLRPKRLRNDETQNAWIFCERVRQTIERGSGSPQYPLPLNYKEINKPSDQKRIGSPKGLVK
jgi:hypothetical protein